MIGPDICLGACVIVIIGPVICLGGVIVIIDPGISVGGHSNDIGPDVCLGGVIVIIGHDIFFRWCHNNDRP